MPAGAQLATDRYTSAPPSAKSSQILLLLVCKKIHRLKDLSYQKPAHNYPPSEFHTQERQLFCQDIKHTQRNIDGGSYIEPDGSGWVEGV